MFTCWVNYQRFVVYNYSIRRGHQNPILQHTSILTVYLYRQDYSAEDYLYIQYYFRLWIVLFYRPRPLCSRLKGSRGIKRRFFVHLIILNRVAASKRTPHTRSINIMSSLISATEIRPIEAESVRRIVAGQAVTDLASAVKELVDNALDAGSKSINSKLKLPLIPLNLFLFISNDSFPSVPFLFAHSLIT